MRGSPERSDMKAKIRYDAETKTYTVTGDTEDNPISFSDVKEVWLERGYPIDNDGAMIVGKGYSLSISHCDIVSK